MGYLRTTRIRFPMRRPALLYTDAGSVHAIFRGFRMPNNLPVRATNLILRACHRREIRCVIETDRVPGNGVLRCVAHSPDSAHRRAAVVDEADQDQLPRTRAIGYGKALM